MQIRIVTLFPDMVAAVGRYGVVSRGVERGLLGLQTVNPRDFAADAHRTVDDRPYGGGPGMVMKFEPLAAAIDRARGDLPDDSPVICLSPQGRRFDQACAERLARLEGLVLVAGRYEGIDERVIEACVDEELSIGDFVLSGGEVPAMAVIDAVARLVPGVLGDAESAANDSFGDGLLDHPHYTRPEVVAGRSVPEVLLSGDHGRIGRWRRREALGRTQRRRPDLLAGRALTDEEQRLLAEWVQEQAEQD
ncbi:MAG: tRNA (guanosine(37)-N1)-methyltransferase TrmD [Pseudomonadota bacterium]